MNVDRLRAHNAETGIILGSGLNALVGHPVADQLIGYSEFSEIPKPSVPGHIGQFVLGQIGEVRVIFAQGRVHLYEGYSAHEVASIVRILAQAGIKRLIVTNAAGSLNPKFKPGTWMMITDHINLTGSTPLIGTSGYDVHGSTQGVAPTFLDLSDAYSRPWREQFRAAARAIGVTLHEGVYVAVVGPQYETPAEVRLLQKLGADAVGMSTVLEVIEARGLNTEVAGFSCLTNLAAGLTAITVTHQEVLDTGREAAADFMRLLEASMSPSHT